MPSSLTRVLPFVLGFSPRPPASVCGTGTCNIVSTFSCQPEFTCFRYSYFAPHHDSASSVRVLHYALASFAWTGSTINRLMLSFCVSASLLQVVLESRLHLVTHTGILSPAPSTVSSDSASASARCSSTARCHLHRLQGLAFSLFSSSGTLFSLPYRSCSTDVFLLFVPPCGRCK